MATYHIERAYSGNGVSLWLFLPERRGAQSLDTCRIAAPKNALDPFVPYAYFWEEEPGAEGDLLPTVTILLTNKECPYRCLMCDLWQNTLDERVPVGAIPAQIRYALERLPAARQIKLYNAGSFFDPQAIPPEDDAAIAQLVEGFERVIVECHPALIGDRCLQFSERLAGTIGSGYWTGNRSPPRSGCAEQAVYRRGLSAQRSVSGAESTLICACFCWYARRL